jgi:hypothetical protein
LAFLLSSSSFLKSPVSSCKIFCIECTANVNTGLLPLQQAPFYFATIECRGPPSETLPFPVVDARTSGEQLVLLQGAHVSDSQPIALALFRPRPLPAAVLAWTPGRVLLLTLALSSSSSSLPVAHAPKPTSSPPPADNPPNGRIHISTLRIRRPWLPVALSSDRQAPLSTSPQALRSLARFSESRPLFQKQYRSIVAITSNLTVAYQRRRRSF